MNLTLGLVLQGSVNDEILCELLEQQGMVYQVVESASEMRTYPLVLMSQYSEETYSKARASCTSESEILLADKIVAFDDVASLLSGKGSERRDNYDLVVTAEGEKLRAAIRERLFELGLPLVRKWYWPGESDACLVLTHDIDWLYYGPFHKQVLKQSANPIRAIRLAFGSLARRKNYGWNIPEIVALEREFGFKSTFFLQTAYGSNDLLSESIQMLKNSSFEIGLHGVQASSFKDLGSLKSELTLFKQQVGHDARGLRYHILKFEAPQTWEIEAAAGLEYDATFYWNRFFGFRAGTCFPYHPFSNGSRLPILELPTAYMDWTSLHRNQSSLDQLETLEKTRMAVEAHHGALVANFHNTYLNRETFPSVYKTFTALLGVAKRRRYWVATAGECANWWRLRASAQVNPRLDSGEVLCSSTDVRAIVERENTPDQVVVSAVGTR